MNSKPAINQTINTIIGDYTYNGVNYNAIIECTPEMFENYADNLYSVIGAANPNGNISTVESAQNIAILLNENTVCCYDKHNKMLYANITTAPSVMDETDRKELLRIFETYSDEEIDTAMDEIASEEDDGSMFSDKQAVLEFISFLEGYAIRFKEFHWDSERKAKHETAERAYDLVYALEDSIAEDMMGMCDSRITPGSVNPVIPADKAQSDKKMDFVDTLKMLSDDTFSFYRKIEHNNNFIGIRSEVENFLHALRQLIYLANMA